jgi:uncharacterized protein YbaR (Trm112 family)
MKTGETLYAIVNPDGTVATLARAPCLYQTPETAERVREHHAVDLPVVPVRLVEEAVTHDDGTLTCPRCGSAIHRRRDRIPVVLADGVRRNKMQHVNDALAMLDNRWGEVTVTNENATEVAHVLERLANLMPKRE